MKTSPHTVLNARIAAIVDQAHLFAYSKNPEEDAYGRTLNKAKYDIDYNSKFAELLIKECWTAIYPFIEDDKLTDDALAEIKERFGV